MNLALEELKLSLERVRLGRREQEFNVLQRMADIERLKKSIEISQAKENEISERIKTMEQGE